MGMWMEIHCDVRKDGQDPRDITISRCYSNRGDTEMGMAHNTKASVEANRKILEKSAIKRGWKKTKGDWACPGCKE